MEQIGANAHNAPMDTELNESRKAAAISYLRKAVETTGMKATHIADKAGLARSTINRPLSINPAKSAPELNTLLAVRRVTGVQFPADLSVVYGLDRGAEEKDGAPNGMRNETTAAKVDFSNRLFLDKDIQVRGSSICGTEGFVIDHSGEPIDYVRRPPGLAKARDVFAVYLHGDSMLPWFKPGDLVFLSEKRPPQVQGLVVVEMHPEHEGEAGISLFKLLVRRTEKYVEVQQSNPPKIFKLEASKIKRIYRVLSNTELLGV